MGGAESAEVAVLESWSWWQIAILVLVLGVVHGLKNKYRKHLNPGEPLPYDPNKEFRKSCKKKTK
jgi:hypothetical protein